MARNVKKEDIYTADFETSGERNLEKYGRVHVWLWSLVNISTNIAEHGSSMESFIDTLRKDKAKIVYFPQSRI